MANKKAQAENETDPLAQYRAAFIGPHGEVFDNPYSVPNVYTTLLYYDAQGHYIDTSNLKEDPALARAIVTGEYYTFRPGDVVILPVWDDELLQKALATGKFASPEAAERIVEAHKKAFEASEAKGGDKDLYNRMVAEFYQKLKDDGLVLLPESGKLAKEEKNEG